MKVLGVILLFLVALAGVVAVLGAVITYLWSLRLDRHDPHAIAFGDAPFMPLGDPSIEGAHGDIPLVSPDIGGR